MSTSDTRKASAALAWALRIFASVGLGASALLLWEYAIESTVFCSAGGGCDLVRLSKYASFFGIPTPMYGVLYFPLVLILAHWPSARARRLLLLVTSAGGLAAVGFILIQVVEIGAFCTFCLIVDVCAALIAVVAFTQRDPAPALQGQAWLAFALVLLVGFGAPFAYGFASRPPTLHVRPPECVLRDETPGPITIVEFVDFQCPYCRQQHLALSGLIDSLGDRLGRPVRIVRRQFPLAMHKFAKDAARAAICAEQAGRGDLMATLLFTSDDLSPQGLETSAVQLGIDPEAFHACMSSASTRQRLEQDEACANAARIQALPTFFVGTERLQGFQRDDTVLAALERAAHAASVQGRASK
jgi:uncharacterized membrane protein/protein-disulfide isomerase